MLLGKSGEMVRNDRTNDSLKQRLFRLTNRGLKDLSGFLDWTGEYTDKFAFIIIGNSDCTQRHFLLRKTYSD